MGLDWEVYLAAAERVRDRGDDYGREYYAAALEMYRAWANHRRIGHRFRERLRRKETDDGTTQG